MTSAVYDVAYLGSVALTRSAVSTPGLGVLQRPILDLYMSYLPPSSKSSSVLSARQLPERRLTLTERGIIISAIDALPSRSADNDAFYAVPSIIFWEAVRFATVRAGDKYRGAFEPVGEDISAAVDNLYMRLDKKNVHLATKVVQHPEILVCVLRRSTAAKQLDVHAFVCDSQEQALTIADHLQWLHACYNDSTLEGLQVSPSTSSSNSQTQDVSYQPPDRSRQQQQLQQQHHQRHNVATSCIDLSADGFVLTQDDVRGKDRVRHADDPTPSYASAPLRPGRAAVARSASSNVLADTRHKPLVSVLTTTDVAAASTWLDDVQQSDDERPTETRPTRARPAYEQSAVNSNAQRADDAGFDFHFGIGAVSSAAPSSSSSSSQQQHQQHQQHQQQQQQSAAASSSRPVAAPSSRPVALVQPHKVTGVRVMPDELSAGLLSWSQNKQAKPTATSQLSFDRSRPSSDAAQQEDGSRLNNKEERRAPAPTSMSSRDQLKATSSRDTGTSSLSLPVNRRREFSSASVAPRPAPRPTTTSDQTVTVSDQLTSKDKEIASVIGNMRLDGNSSTTQNTLSAHGTNFEKCLGYFP